MCKPTGDADNCEEPSAGTDKKSIKYDSISATIVYVCYVHVSFSVLKKV